MIQERSGWSGPFPLFHMNYKSWDCSRHTFRKRSRAVKPCTTLTPYPSRAKAAKGQKEGSFLNPQEFFDEIILQTEMSLLLFVPCLAPVTVTHLEAKAVL